MKKLLLFISAILLIGCNQKSGSEAVMNKGLPSSVKIARDSTELSFQERIKYLKKGLQEIQQNKNDSTYLDNLSKVSLISLRLKDSVLFRSTNKMVYQEALKAENFKVLGETQWDMAAYHRDKSTLDSAYFYFRRAYQHFAAMPTDSASLSLKARMLYSMAQMQEDFKDYLGAESNVAKAIRIYEELGDNKRLIYSYNQLGIISSAQKNYDKGLEYYGTARIYIDKLDDKRSRWTNQNNIAHLILRKKDFSKALELYEKLLNDPMLASEYPRLYGKVLVSSTYAKFKQGGLSEKLNQNYNEALKVNKDIDDLDDIARTHHFMAELLTAQSKPKEALAEAKLALGLAKENHKNERQLEVLRLLTELDAENAVAYSKDYYALSEQIKEEERTKRDKFARIRLETDQVIEQNTVLTRQKQIWIGVVVGLTLLGIAVFMIISQRIRNNKLKFEQTQQESNQEIYNLMLGQQGKFEEGKKLEQKRISEELHDGILGEMLGIRLVLGGLNERTDEQSQGQRAELIEKLRGVEEEIRTISHELSHASYQKIHNFIVSVEDMIRNIEASSGIACSFTYDDHLDWDDLQGDIKINAYRIVQESLQNCVKHAQCENALVDFDCDKQKLTLTISDDGVGFDTGKGKKGIGLRNIVSRVKKINGTLQIESKKNKGTTVTVSLPVVYQNIDGESTGQELMEA
ncbi:MAG: sensor histidine kinase [Bacteroidota bacterium]